MADILLDTVDLTVFGGPTTVDVSVDFGAEGVRGSKIWSGPGAPEVYLVGQSIQINDLYINTNQKFLRQKQTLQSQNENNMIFQHE